MLDAALMHPAISGPLHILGSDLEDKKWVFILGCYNSGTTLLAELLQAHTNLDGLRNEGAFLTDSLPYPERHGWPRMWIKCADQLRVSSDDATRARRIRRHWSLWRKGNAEHVVEKSISNVLRIDFLQENFNGPTFVHIVRNGYAVAAGIRNKANLRRWRNPDGYSEYPISLCARQWVESLSEVRRAEKRGVEIKTVHYEDVVSDPVSTLAPVFESIGVDAIADMSRWGEFSVHEKKSRITNMNESSISTLSGAEIAEIRDIAGESLATFGYESSLGI